MVAPLGRSLSGSRLRASVARARRLLLVLLAGSIVFAPAPAWSFGFGVTKDGGPIALTHHSGLLVLDGETLNWIGTFSFKGTGAPFAWVMPVPAGATVQLGGGEIRRRIEGSGQSWGPLCWTTFACGFGGTRAELRVEPLAAATDLAGLRAWLKERRLRPNAAEDALLDSLAVAGSSFLAVAVPKGHYGERDPFHERTLPSLWFRWSCVEPVIAAPYFANADHSVGWDLSIAAPTVLLPTAPEWTVQRLGPLREGRLPTEMDRALQSQGDPPFVIALRCWSSVSGRFPELRLRRLDPAAVLANNAPLPLSAQNIATYVGWARPPEGYALLRRAARGAGADADLSPVAWAFGEVGDARAVPLLDSLAAGEDDWTREIARAALAKLDPALACAHAVAELSVTSEEGRRSWLPTFEARDEILYFLVQNCDERCLPRLAAFADSIDARRQWIECQSSTFGARLFATLALLGDAEARRMVVSAIVEEGRAIKPDLLDRFAEATGESEHGAPNAFWPGVAIDENRLDPWVSFDVLHDAARPNGSRCEPLVREVLADSLITDVARLILLVQVAPDSADVDTARAIWRRALAPGADRISFALDPADVAGTLPLDLNVAAATVAHLLARWHRADELREMAAASEADSSLRGELAFALASAGDSTDVPWLVRYVREEWPARAAELDRGPREQRPDASEQPEPRSVHLDVGHRERAIKQALAQRMAERWCFDALIADPTLPPLLRVFWIDAGAESLCAHLALEEEAERVLDQLRPRAKKGSTLAAWIASARSALDRSLTARLE